MRAPARLGLFVAALGAVFGLSFLGGRLVDGDAASGVPSTTTVPMDEHRHHGSGTGR